MLEAVHGHTNNMMKCYGVHSQMSFKFPSMIGTRGQDLTDTGSYR